MTLRTTGRRFNLLYRKPDDVDSEALERIANNSLEFPSSCSFDNATSLRKLANFTSSAVSWSTESGMEFINSDSVSELFARSRASLVDQFGEKPDSEMVLSSLEYMTKSISAGMVFKTNPDNGYTSSGTYRTEFLANITGGLNYVTANKTGTKNTNGSIKTTKKRAAGVTNTFKNLNKSISKFKERKKNVNKSNKVVNTEKKEDIKKVKKRRKYAKGGENRKKGVDAEKDVTKKRARRRKFNETGTSSSGDNSSSRSPEKEGNVKNINKYIKRKKLIVAKKRGSKSYEVMSALSNTSGAISITYGSSTSEVSLEPYSDSTGSRDSSALLHDRLSEEPKKSGVSDEPESSDFTEVPENFPVSTTQYNDFTSVKNVHESWFYDSSSESKEKKVLFESSSESKDETRAARPRQRYSSRKTVSPKSRSRMPRVAKADAKPRGRMTAYAFFVQICREEHKKKHPEENVVFSEFSKKCAERWKTMSDKEKKRFHEMADRDKKRYDTEMQSYVPPKGEKQRGKKRKHIKDPNAPKRSLSAFFWFCNDERSKVKGANPEFGVGDIAKELGRRWANADSQTKLKYEAMAEKDKARYEREMSEYKKKPKGPLPTVVPPKKNENEDEEDGEDEEEEEEDE